MAAPSLSVSSPAFTPSATSTRATPTTSTFPFNLLTTATITIPPAHSSYLKHHFPSMVQSSSYGLHKLPRNLKIKKVKWNSTSMSTGVALLAQVSLEEADAEGTDVPMSEGAGEGREIK
ncbi:hypothetical protein GYMLUDRAFT_243540 [Collybiopsis luxurians FD-317 M1]|uniref:Uncharacterized protein n=1 Tax=Collybiopsis luxurians FD-317 M1 TaxID=944289 RepID=A0A0D0CFI6_9AGAR|nr:hypothetical protein GYMLUDRAFT_243540 [Collybiopsis luxurians FD-317 M1]